MNEQDIWNTVPNNTTENENNTDTKDEIVCIIDCSTSMRSIKQEAQDGINQFIKTQQQVGPALFTLVEFNNTSRVVHNRININEVPEYTLHPEGMTALCDAIGSACATVKPTTGKTIIVIVTDGDENASQELSPSDIKTVITEKKMLGWEFIFLAANQDAIKVGHTLGIDSTSSVNFSASPIGAAQAYDAISIYTAEIRTNDRTSAIQKLQDVVSTSSDLG